MNELYRCIAADPPWNERGGGGVSKRGADRHYPLLSTPEIVRVMLSASAWRPAESCHLWLWVTNNYLDDGLFVMKALGFRYVTNLAWSKPSFGLGFYLRGQHELCLFGTRGATMRPNFHDAGSVIQADKAAHSRKPEEFYELIERVSPAPRLEMFARSRRAGWDSFGNDAALGESA